IGQPFLGKLVLVFAGIEQAGHARRGDRRFFLLDGVTVIDAAARPGAAFQIVVGLGDDDLRHLDGGIVGGAQRLHLGNRDGPLILVVAVDFGGVVPAAAGRLGGDAVLGRAVQNILEPVALVLVLLVAVD